MGVGVDQSPRFVVDEREEDLVAEVLVADYVAGGLESQFAVVYPPFPLFPVSTPLTSSWV